MTDNSSHVRKWHGRRPFSIDDEAIVDFLGITKGMSILDIGGADGYYSKRFATRGAAVTIIDAYDYDFKGLNGVGIKTILRDFCIFDGGNYDLVFMAHVYHDLVHSCKKKALENLSRVSSKCIANLDFTKDNFGFGPPISERLTKEEVVQDMRSIGFILERSMDLPFHYLQVFVRE